MNVCIVNDVQKVFSYFEIVHFELLAAYACVFSSLKSNNSQHGTTRNERKKGTQRIATTTTGLPHKNARTARHSRRRNKLKERKLKFTITILRALMCFSFGSEPQTEVCACCKFITFRAKNKIINKCASSVHQ